MSVITREDKHKNVIEFRPLDKRYRYKVNGETKRGSQSSGIEARRRWGRKVD